MFKSPAAHGSNPLDFVNSGLEHLVIDALSPQHLSTVGPRSKPRINTSCSPISTAYHGSQNEKLNSKIDREREIYSNSKRDEARIRKELEESKVIECFGAALKYFAVDR